jgi:hypothetical protein
MLILADNDVTGAVAVLRRTLESGEWAEYAAQLDLRFLRFADLGLLRNASDRSVWQACQAAGAVLITANRTGGDDSLERTLDELSGPDTLPVITLADPQRIFRDPSYAADSALQLLDYLERIHSLRGTVRLFVP